MPAEGATVTAWPSGGIAIVVSGGATRASIRHARLPDHLIAPFVIAADGGLDAALGLGFGVDLVIGDFDSVDPVQLEAMRMLDPSPQFERFAAEKDATDLELAMDAAWFRGARSIVVVDSMCGRVDHFLATAMLLANVRYRDAVVTACIDGAVVHVVHGGSICTFQARGSAALVSVLAVGGDALGVRTTNLVYPLNGEMLCANATRGMSNVVVAANVAVTVAVTEGVVLVIEPEAEDLR